ncbi:MAG: ATP-binding protein [Phycisphaerales bacterium]|nr:ATP-binding protein [Phycisphaerales bacterium]MCB9840944.1 ATP-binding protein [Phycisphaeraceae bacterium]
MPDQPSSPPAERLVARVANDRDEINAVEGRLLEALDRFQYSKASRFAVRLAVEEALTNAFRHGHRALPKATPVLLDLTVGREEVRIAVEDQGPGFDPGGVPDPTLDENLDKPAGRGLMLMRAYMARIEYNPKGNRVTLTYRRPESQ